MCAGFRNMIKHLNDLLQKQYELIGMVIQILFEPQYLVFTNVILSMILAALGDIVEQKYEIMKNEIPGLSLTRVRNMSIAGCLVGALIHLWYQLLDKTCPGRSFTTVLTKVLIDQIVSSPATLCLFFLTLALLEGQSFEEFLDDCKTKGMQIYIAEWIIWPPVQIINFYWLPTRFRVLYEAAFSFGYDVYISQVRHEMSMDKFKTIDTI